MFGDSHCDIFANCHNQQRFNLHTAVFTIPRLANLESWTALWPTLDTWLSSASGQDLVVSIGEIDIRAHAWRQYPRVMYSKTINEYIKELAHTLYSTLVRIQRRHKLNRCVLWGAPPAHDNKLYNQDWPFSGSTSVRNRCVHLFNCEFQRLVLANPTNGIGFATAYYAFVDSDFNSINDPSHDGVHYRDAYGPEFWRQLILPAFTHGVAIAGQPLLESKYKVVARAKNMGVRLADTWISGEGVAGEHSVEFQGRTYYYVKKDGALPCSEYWELELE
jgi:hypothetical protein